MDLPRYIDLNVARDSLHSLDSQSQTSIASTVMASLSCTQVRIEKANARSWNLPMLPSKEVEVKVLMSACGLTEFFF